MEVIEKLKKIPLAKALGHFPRGHVLAVAALGVSLAVVSMLPSEPASAKRQEQEIAIPALSAVEQEEHSDTLPVDPEPLPEPEPEYNIASETVRSGDNLSRLFARAGLSDRHMMTMLNSCDDCDGLRRLYPGHTLEFAIDEQGELASLTYLRNRLESHIYRRTDTGYVFEEVRRQPDVQTAMRSGQIETSLYEAGKQAQMNDKLLMELANIFGWDIDFALDIRKGDSFRVLYEEHFLDGEKLGEGDILAAEFVNQGDVFRAVRYVDENGEVSYYTPEGKSMRKAFLRAPLDFRRISGNFNPRRLHPVFKTVRPHRGTDYAASRGTPVWASGDGRVIASSYSQANGNYIFIQHGNNIVTKYLHLHKRYVKKGDRVKQRQRIGSVGSTGYSTGPHLHYEFLIDGVHRNPRTVINKLPKADSVPETELARFREQTSVWLAELTPEQQPTQYASSEALDGETRNAL